MRLTRHGRILHLVGPRSQRCPCVSVLNGAAGRTGGVHWSPRKSPRDIFCCSFFLGAADKRVSHGALLFGAVHCGAKKVRGTRRVTPALRRTAGRQRTHDCDEPSTRVQIIRALSESREKSRRLLFVDFEWWCVESLAGAWVRVRPAVRKSPAVRLLGFR